MAKVFVCDNTENAVARRAAAAVADVDKRVVKTVQNGR